MSSSDTACIGIIRTKDSESHDLVCDRCDQGWRVYVKPNSVKDMPSFKMQTGLITTVSICPALVKTILKLDTHIRCNACGSGLLKIPRLSRFHKDNLIRVLEQAKGFIHE